MLNTLKPLVTKISKVEKLMEQVILIIFIIQAIFSFLIALFNGFWTNSIGSGHRDFIGPISNPLVATFLTLLTVLVLTSSLVPLSLLISLEIVRIGQAYFIE